MYMPTLLQVFSSSWDAPLGCQFSNIPVQQHMQPLSSLHLHSELIRTKGMSGLMVMVKIDRDYPHGTSISILDEIIESYRVTFN